MWMDLWHNWKVIVFVAPALWAIVNIIDLYFVGDVYKNAHEGATITGFIQLLVLLPAPFLSLTLPDLPAIIFSILSGFCLVVSYFFYFRALFKDSDATFLQILWNTVSILTPILAFIFLGERLFAKQYLGILVVLTGVFLISFKKKASAKDLKKVLWDMSGAVLFFSLQMIFAKEAYTRASFTESLMFYSVGAILAGVLFFVLNYISYHRHLHFFHHTHSFFKEKKQYFHWFFLVEVVTLLGVITAQWVINIAPSVSLVSVIEPSSQPVFIIIFSVLIFLFAKVFLSERRKNMKFFHNEQLDRLPIKLVAMIIMAIGVYLIG